MAETLMGWLAPDRVIYAQDRTQTMTEMVATVNRVIAMMEQSSAEKVHHIIDQSNQPVQAENIDISDANQELSRFLKHPKTGWVLTCYGSNMYMQYVNWVLAYENQARSQHFENAQSAVDFLMTIEPSLTKKPNVQAFLEHFG